MEEITQTTHKARRDPLLVGKVLLRSGAGENDFAAADPLHQDSRPRKPTVPTNTPEPVRWTIWAIGDMWTKHGTDRPDEVQWWLQQEWGTQT